MGRPELAPVPEAFSIQHREAWCLDAMAAVKISCNIMWEARTRARTIDAQKTDTPRVVLAQMLSCHRTVSK